MEWNEWLPNGVPVLIPTWECSLYGKKGFADEIKLRQEMHLEKARRQTLRATRRDAAWAAVTLAQ